MAQVEKSQAPLAAKMAGWYAPFLLIACCLHAYPTGVGLPLADRSMSTGMDLAGNTFWEFKDSMNANRLRRIAQYNPKTHYADIQISRKSWSISNHYTQDGVWIISVTDEAAYSSVAFLASPFTSGCP